MNTKKQSAQITETTDETQELFSIFDLIKVDKTEQDRLKATSSSKKSNTYYEPDGQAFPYISPQKGKKCLNSEPEDFFFKEGVTDESGFKIEALRGVILKGYGGLEHWGENSPLLKTKEPGEAKGSPNLPVCRTIGRVNDDGSAFVSTMPFTNFALSNPEVWSEGLKDPNYKGSPDPKLSLLMPFGSKGMSCVECVAKGQNKVAVKTAAGKEEVSVCAGRFVIVFCIFEVGVLKKDLSKAGQYTIEWRPIEDLEAEDGSKPFAEPVIVTMTFSKATGWRKLGDDPKYNTVVKTSSDAVIPGGYVPKDVQTIKTYIDGLIEANSYYPLDKTNGSPIHPDQNIFCGEYVEMYRATPVTSISNLDRIPAFRSISIESTDFKKKYLKAASIYSEKITAFKDKQNLPTRPTELPMRRVKEVAGEDLKVIEAATENNANSPEVFQV